MGSAKTRSGRLLAVFVLAAAVAVVSAGPVSAQQPTAEQQCIIQAAEQNKEVKECVKTPNPILPETHELLWGSLAFVALFVVMRFYGYPSVKKGMDARAEKIKSSLDEAESTRTEAQGILDEYRKQLADAKNESARIIEEARQAADKLRQDLKRQAEAEVADVKSQAEEDIAAQLDRARADLHSRVADLSVDLAEKVVDRRLDRQTNLALVENYIRETEAAR